MALRPGPSRLIRRRRLLVVVAVVAAATGSAVLLGRSAARVATSRAPLRIVAGTRTVATIDRGLLESREPAARARVRLLLSQRVPASEWVALAHARVRYRNDRSATARLAMQATEATATVALVRHAIESRIDAPVLRQRLRNDCESAALSILFATQGKSVSQVRVQGLLPRSGPLDPQGEGATRVWGDPDQGFVGRPNGGGTAGGFGVYPGPIVRVAQRLGVGLRNLTGTAPQTVYRRLLAGRAVIAWVGLSSGPFGSWRSPAGRPITVNFGEHTVVLRGIDGDGSLLVSNPLQGTAETWSRAEFESMWNLLGRRAVGT